MFQLRVLPCRIRRKGAFLARSVLSTPSRKRYLRTFRKVTNVAQYDLMEVYVQDLLDVHYLTGQEPMFMRKIGVWEKVNQ